MDLEARIFEVMLDCRNRVEFYRRRFNEAVACAGDESRATYTRGERDDDIRMARMECMDKIDMIR